MSNPRFLIVPPQPYEQRGRNFQPPAAADIIQAHSLVLLGGHLVAVKGQALPTTSVLNASVSSAVVQPRSSDTAGIVVFNTSAGIAAFSNLFTVTFATPYMNPPVVIPGSGGGGGGNNAFFVAATSTTSFQVWCSLAVGASAGFIMQWIAVGQ